MNKDKNSIQMAIGLVAGVVFGVGLTLSGMVDPAKVIGFLDVTGDWDPSLALVMGGALLITTPIFTYSKSRMAKPITTAEFNWPSRQDIDAPLLTGASLFGVGWGLSGFCPGPALASIAFANTDSLLFLAAMLVGTVVGRLFNNHKTTAATA